jgi:hypothetical protein
VEHAAHDPQAFGAPSPGADGLFPAIEDVDIAQGPDVVIAKQLLDHAMLLGFTFQRAAPGIDAPLVGHRVGEDCIDLIHIEGFSRDCSAWREWTSSLIVSPDDLGQRQHHVRGSALHVLSEVLTWEPSP